MKVFWVFYERCKKDVSFLWKMKEVWVKFLSFFLFHFFHTDVPAPFRKNGILTILSLPINEQSYYYAVPLCIFGNFPCTKVCFFLNYYIDSSFILTGVNMSLHPFTFNWMRGMPFKSSAWNSSCPVSTQPVFTSFHNQKL